MNLLLLENCKCWLCLSVHRDGILQTSLVKQIALTALDTKTMHKTNNIKDMKSWFKRRIL